jgi:hypothetical protein
MAKGYPLRPVIANLFVEHFQEMFLAHSTHKRLRFFRYVYDTWQLGRETLEKFVHQRNGPTGI